MAPRLSKRQQREQDELVALASSHAAPSTDLHESAEEALLAPPAKTGFAALFTPEDDQVEPGESEDDTTKPTKSRKAKKKKKKIPEETQPAKPEASSLQSKPGAKRTKGKDKKDDLDKALEELSIKYPDLQQIATNSSVDTRATKLSALLSVSVSHLDAESELKKFFGSKAVSAAQAATSSPKKRHGIQPQIQRSQLTRPQPSWGAIKQRDGLSVRPLTEEEASEKMAKGPAGPGKWWTVEYSKRYKGITKTFMQAVMTGDPDTLWRVMQRMPWHADTLLQLAEVARHREEYSQAVDYVSRALYAYERAFLGAFSFTSGNNRLDFDRVENRPFFLAIHRQVIDLQRRGCPRTAFEHARLLLSLEPLSDPHGMYLHLDYLCVKTGLGDWLLDVWSVYRNTPDKDLGEYMDPSILPGWAYARALILRAKEKEKKERGEDFKEESTEALRQAIFEFPSIVPLLADKCEISLSAEVRGHKAFRIYTDRIGLTPEESILHLLSHLYVLRSAPLWKPSVHASWLSSTSNALLPTLSKTKYLLRDRFLRTFSSLKLRYPIYRHVFVLEQTHAQPQNRVLTAFIPPDITQGRQLLACDPLPPPTSLSTYDAAFFAGAEDPFAITGSGSRTRRRTQADERRLARLIPDAAARAQVVAIYDQNPWIAAQVPGGVVRFAQIIAEAPEDVLEELLAAAVMHEAAGAGVGVGDVGAVGVGMGVLPELANRGVMPGQLMEEDEDEVFWEADEGVGDDVHDEDESEDEEEDLARVAPLPVRVLRNFFNRFWGGAPAEDDSSEDGHADNNG